MKAPPPAEPQGLLGLTRVAFACQSVADIPARQQPFTIGAGASAQVLLGSARVPRRDLSSGSLFWIIRHTLVARQAILEVEEQPGERGSRALIRLSAEIVPVMPRHCRSHQGWRYLAQADWPADTQGDQPVPPELAAELAALGL